MAVKAIISDTAAIRAVNPPKSSKSKVGDVSVFLYIAEAMNSKINESLKCLKMDRDAAEKESIQNALNLANGLDVTKNILESLINAAKESGDTELVNWLEGLKNNVDGLIAIKDKALKEYQNALKEVKADKDILAKVKLDIFANNEQIKKLENEISSKDKNGTVNFGKTPFLNDLQIGGLETLNFFEKGLKLAAENSPAIRSFLNWNGFKDICGVGQATDNRVIEEVFISSLSPVGAILFYSLVPLISQGKENGYDLLGKGLDLIDKKIGNPARVFFNKKFKEGMKDWNEPISSNVQSESANPFGGAQDPIWMQYPRKYIGAGAEIGGAAIGKFVFSATDKKNEAFQSSLDLDKNTATNAHTKESNLDSTGLGIVQDQVKSQTQDASNEILNNQKAQNDFETTVDQIASESKIFNNLII
jgi:hypothetical protein